MRVGLTIVSLLLVALCSYGGDFPLKTEHGVVPVYVDQSEAFPIKRAVGDLSKDIGLVVGDAALVVSKETDRVDRAIVVGQLGSGGFVDELAAQGLIDLSVLQDQWESFIIQEVEEATPFAERTLVIAGSDMRGTIYGIYELSKQMGVSPWYWWADVPVIRNPDAAISGERLFISSPSVKYRGIFINDEDWGLQPWAAKTFDPEFGDIGPKTYAKVFELLLRLRANCLWPAMHKISRPFNDGDDIRNAELADQYGIVMSSSHAEPMLRNNVREWTLPHKDYNYLENAEGVGEYWEKRVESNGSFENIYTLGMRGIHDSGMRGGASIEEQCGLIERIISDQRNLLKKHVNDNVTSIPQTFVAYKEVLELYRNGLDVPDDVTIVWPDDNFGFIRNFADAKELDRAGKFGVYYHISYLGRPMAYLWLNTMPPALIWEEMTKAYAWGAESFWMLNVGDIKPAEIGMDFFFKLAWDVESWDQNVQPEFLKAWASEIFQIADSDELTSIMSEYYTLNLQRKPEHLQFYMPLSDPKCSRMSVEEIETRLSAFTSLAERVESIKQTLPAESMDSFFELVEYPIKGTRLANERYFQFELFQRLGEEPYLERSKAAHNMLIRLTGHYNHEVQDGKWNHFIQLEPADDDWRSMRIKKWTFDEQQWEIQEPQSEVVWATSAANFQEQESVSLLEWKTVTGLGRSGEAMAILPYDPSTTAYDLPTISYRLPMLPAGSYALDIELLPTFPVWGSGYLSIEVSVDGNPFETISIPRKAKSLDWKHGVLEANVKAALSFEFGDKSPHLITIRPKDPSIVIDRLVLR